MKGLKAVLLGLLMSWYFGSSAATKEDFLRAIKNGDLSTVKKMLAQNEALLQARDAEGESPLFWASYRNKPAMVDFLLSKKADVNVKDVHQQSILQIALYRNSLRIVKALLAAGASVVDKDADKATPLHYAVQFGYENPQAVTKEQWSENAQIVKALIDAGADLYAQDTFGNTPLFYAQARMKMLSER